MNLCWILLTTLFTFVELNCENLFDYRHEEGKDGDKPAPLEQRALLAETQQHRTGNHLLRGSKQPSTNL